MSGKTNDYSSTTLSGSIDTDLQMFKAIFKNDSILRIRNILRSDGAIKCALIYFDGMVNVSMLNESVVKPLITANIKIGFKPDINYVAESILFAGEVKAQSIVADMIRAFLYGDTLLLLDGSTEALTINTKGWRTRGISEPSDERVLKGPREGFDEAAMLNLAMIRRKLLTPDLCIESVRIGRRTDTAIFICYLETLADKKTVYELKRRLSKIDIDGILDSNYIAEQIRDHRHSLLKTTGSTERPDTVAARLLEGRIAVVVDGTPCVLTLPYLFSESFQSDEDYYINYASASVGRILRYICFFIAVSVPAVFLALCTFHIKLLPTSFALTVAKLRNGVPMSSAAECIVLIIVFEILRETGIRMPQGLGHALSIVGGLVVGQAAVEARIVSAPMLIAVALSGISGLMIPRLSSIVFYLRLALVISAAFFGLYGYLTLAALFTIRVFTLSSFGVDYTSSLRRPGAQQLKDTVIRAPWSFMKKRPVFNKNIIRNKTEDN